MSMNITGLGSGFDINTIVSQLVALKESTTVSPLESKLSALQGKNTALSSLKTKFSTLQSTLQSFTRTIYDSSSDMWAQTSVSSSNDAYATASAAGNVAASQIELFVEQIATSTTAKSTKSLGVADLNTKYSNLANGQTKAGSFSMFLDGKEYSIDIKEDNTLDDIIKAIDETTQGKIKAEINSNGVFSIKAQDENSTLILGSAGDTSNFASALRLHDKIGTSGYSSSYSLSAVNTTTAMNNPESGLAGLKFYDEEGNAAQSGKIIINGVEIEVDGEMSINKLISKINSNSDTKVRASFDSLKNEVILTSTQTGQNNISLKSEGTNLLNVLGLTQGEGENEVIALGSQELGQNAIVHINGNKVISNSNTITGESSGVANLSITVKKPTGDYSQDENADKSVVLDVAPDHSKIKTALEKFVNAYNDVVATAQEMSAADGKIGRDASLNSIISQLRSITSKVSENDGMYSMLAQIGIETNTADLSKLKIDTSKLDKALNENLDSVKNLLSDGYVEKADTGIFDNILTTINSVLDTERGYFKTQNDSVQSQIKNMNNRIERATTRLNAYEIQITNQFNKMDTTISNLNSQLSTFMSYIG